MRASLLTLGLTACVLVPSSSVLVHATGVQLTERCLAEDPDGLKLRAAREKVANECPCGTANYHFEHTACAATVARSEVALGNLPQSCVGAAYTCAAKSTCGRDGGGWVACCIYARTGRMCRLARSVTACLRMRGTPNSHSPTCTSCCDACPDPGDGPSCEVPAD